MSLINKMLNDLEKRDAYLHDKQDVMLDGLYSAYDVELKTKKKNYISFLFPLGLIVTAIIIFIYLSVPNTENNREDLYIVDEVVNTPEQVVVEALDLEPEFSSRINKKVNADSSTFLKLDTGLIISDVSQNAIVDNLNRIEEINFENNSSGLNLVMKTPYDIDYLVYNLKNPDRTVVEVENARLGFRFEELQPIEPIVAIRYSINENNRFKLVLESNQPLVIRKSTTSEINDIHSLVVSMDYQWDKGITEKDDEDLFSEIVEQQVQNETAAVFKGELIKTPASQNNNAYAEKLFQQAFAKYKAGNISESLKQLNMVLDHDAGHVNARTTLALILSQQGHNELAYSVLNEGLIQFPDKVDWIKMTAHLYLNEGKIIAAKDLLAGLKPPLPSNTEYYALQAAVLQKLNEHNESARLYRDLLQVNPLNPVWWMGLGISLESMKRYDDALYAYQKALNNSALASDSKEFVSKRLLTLNNLLKDESS